MTIHSSILAWKLPWTEEAGRLQSMRWQRAGTMEHTHTYMALLLLLLLSRFSCVRLGATP